MICAVLDVMCDLSPLYTVQNFSLAFKSAMCDFVGFIWLATERGILT